MISYPPRSSQLLGPNQIRRPVFGFDIDGCLAFYHQHFAHFAELWLGRYVRDGSDYDGTDSFASYLGVSKATYRKMKLAYRRGGFKRWMPERSGASELVYGLRERGAEVVICTTRPYLSLENVDEDTRHWLVRNGIPFDEIIWGEHKWRDLKKARGDRVVAILEDLPSLCVQAVDAGIPAVFQIKTSYQFDWNPSNEHIWTSGEIQVVDSLQDAAVEMHRELTIWEEKYRG